MTRDHDVLPLRLAKEARQVVLNFRQRNLLYSGLPICLSQDSASDFETIANTSTTDFDTS